jgi:NAD(P)-dependent dehydrogenase (short-subunit alcohol dehydrogenase family)
MTNVLITGSSTGIGKACALHLDRQGWTVYAGVRKEADADDLRRAGSAKLTPVIIDVTDQSQIDAVAKQIEADSGRLDGLVNNAGIGRGGPLEYLDLDEWRSQLEVNVIGQIAVTKAMLPLIRPAKGRVVFIGSIGGRLGSPLMGPYNASKFAIEGIGHALRQELKPKGVHVSVIEPGAIDTEIWNKAEDTLERLRSELPPIALEEYAEVMATFEKGLTMNAKNGISADVVAKVVEHALTAKRPRTRYLVGKDAKAVGALGRFLPDRALDVIVAKITKLS